MGDAERRTIPELLVRYEFEPGLKDIYVEGSEDKAVLDGVFYENGMTGISVFEIATVDIPNDTGTENNNRTRLIKLSNILTKTPETAKTSVVCVIDSDFDYLEKSRSTCDKLIKTDYANLEMYFFEKDIINKLNTRILCKHKLLDRKHYDFIVMTLVELFKIRYINSRPIWQLKYLSFDKLLQYTKGEFNFDCDEYLKRYLSKNSRISEYEIFASQLKSIKIPNTEDIRCYIHGHDFLELLCYVLNCLSGKQMYPCQESVLSILKASSDYNKIICEPMFEALNERFGNC